MNHATELEKTNQNFNMDKRAKNLGNIKEIKDSDKENVIMNIQKNQELTNIANGNKRDNQVTF